MSFLLDTNAVSEFVKLRPDPGFLNWLNATDEFAVHLSVATIAELRFGIDTTVAGARRRKLEDWLISDLPARFEGRIVPVDLKLADEWGRVSAMRKAKGRPIQAMDALIAATANAFGFTLVTRNVKDFAGTVTKILNPWTG